MIATSRQQSDCNCHTAGARAASFTDPPSGSVIGYFEGIGNAITITCNITNSMGVQITTQWNLENYGNRAPGVLVDIASVPNGLFQINGDPIPGFSEIYYDNRLTGLNLTSVLDKVIVHCGSGIQSNQAHFTFRIYRMIVV